MTNIYHGSVWSKFSPGIDILDHCDLASHDFSWQQLYSVLRPFSGYTFAHNQRLLILDHDTDYYPSVSCVGNTLHNLIKLISELDISSDHVVILTANYGLESDVRMLCDQLNLSCPKVIEFSQWYTFPSSVDEKPYFAVPPSYLYLCLNYQPRVHRQILISLLHEKNLFTQGLISWHAPQDIVDHYRCPVLPFQMSVPKLNAFFRVTDPFTRINDSLSLCAISAKLLTKYSKTLNNTVTHPLITGKANDENTRWGADFFDHALLYLITETVGQYRHVYFSEKTWKAIASKKPFLLLGAQNSLLTLKKLGFATFDTVWDESYDQAVTLYERANLLTDVLTTLSRRDWNEIIQQCKAIVEHNHNNLVKLQQQHLEQLSHI